MKPITLLILLFSCFKFCVNALPRNNTNLHLKCYVCESETTEACEDPAVKAVLTSTSCDNLIYPEPREEAQRSVSVEVLSKTVDGKFRGKPILREIFEKDVGERANLPFRYTCIKVTFSSGDKAGTTRTCEKVPSNVEDVCDFIIQETGKDFKVDVCNSCEEDNCNSATNFSLSLRVVVATIFMIIQTYILV